MVTQKTQAAGGDVLLDAGDSAQAAGGSVAVLAGAGQLDRKSVV